MPEFLGPESFAAELAELRRRLHALETAPQSNRSMLTNGSFAIRTGVDPNVLVSMDVDGEADDAAFRVFDSSGSAVQVIYIGTTGDGIAGYAEILNDDRSTAVFVARSDQGIVRPVLMSPWQKSSQVPEDANGNATTTSGTYTDLFVSYLNASTHVNHQWWIDLGGGVTSVAFKLTAVEVGGSPETTVYEQTGITADGFITQSTALPAGIATGDLPGRFLELKAYLRITGGAGTAGLAPHRPAYSSQG